MHKSIVEISHTYGSELESGREAGTLKDGTKGSSLRQEAIIVVYKEEHTFVASRGDEATRGRWRVYIYGGE